MTLQSQTQPIVFNGPCGQLEGMLSEPDGTPRAIAVICHPHPLQEGTMHNKVVTTLAKVFFDLHCTVVRFNYRGVGNSAGSYDDARGESDDALAAIAWLQAKHPDLPLWLAGFSFGSYVAANAASRSQPAGLISIAPPVERMPFDDLTINCPWWVIQGTEDKVAAPQATRDWLATTNQTIQSFEMAETSHFFHGKLIQLHDLISEQIGTYFED